MKESPVAAPRWEYENPIEVTPVGELQEDDEPPRLAVPTAPLVEEDLFGLDESDESEPETKRKKGKGKKKSAQETQREHALAIAGPILEDKDVGSKLPRTRQCVPPHARPRTIHLTLR